MPAPIAPPRKCRQLASRAVRRRKASQKRPTSSAVERGRSSRPSRPFRNGRRRWRGWRGSWPRVLRRRGAGGVMTSIGLFETSEQADESTLLFETSDQADESTRVVSNWVRDEKLDTALPNSPKI